MTPSSRLRRHGGEAEIVAVSGVQANPGAQLAQLHPASMTTAPAGG